MKQRYKLFTRSLLVRMYGSVSMFLKNMGDQHLQKRMWTQEMLIKALCSLYNKLNRRPTQQEFFDSGVDKFAVYSRFGNWKNFLVSAKQDVSHLCMKQDWTKGRLQQHFLKLEKTIKKQPSSKTFFKSAHIGEDTLTKFFNKPCWKGFLTSMGKEPLVVHKTWPSSKKSIVKVFYSLQNKLKKQPTGFEFIKKGCPLRTLDRVFGKPGWRNFLKYLGKNICRNDWNKEKLIKAYLILEVKLNRQPTITEATKSGIYVSTLNRYFGKPGWKTFLKAMNRKPLYRTYNNKFFTQKILEIEKFCHTYGHLPSRHTSNKEEKIMVSYLASHKVDPKVKFLQKKYITYQQYKKENKNEKI